MTTTNNQLPIDKQPIGDICIPVSVPNDGEWLWLLAKCLSFPTAKRFWVKGNIGDIETVRQEWDSRVYNPVVEKIIAGDLCAELSEDNCLDYPSNHGMIDYQPMNPFVNPDEVPEGYLLPPFVRYADLLFEDLPDWLADLVAEITGEFTGYEPNDVLTLIGSFPLDLTEWQGALENGLPRFTVTVQDKGTLELHLLGVPFGSRALITLDVEPNIGDIFAGIISGDVTVVELNRDLSSIPPETNVELVHEVQIETSGEHVVHVTFVPAANDELIPISFGGGVRSVTWCPNNVPDPEPCPECTIEELLADEDFFNDEYLPATLGDWYTATNAHNDDLNAAYDGTAQSIGEDIPTGIPNDQQDFALCAALCSFVKLYASSKLCIIQSKNFIQVAWNELLEAANAVYEALVNSMAFIYTPNLYSCFVDDTEAISVLQDSAAQEELACFLLEDLDSHTMTEANFSDAISSAATTLSGNAQKLACIMLNDLNQTVYLNFLQAYQIKLNQTLQGNDIDCPCLIGTYRIYRHEFVNGMGKFKFVYSGATQAGSLVSGRVKGTAFPSSQYLIQMAWDDFDPTWRIHTVRLEGERINGQGSGTVDSDSILLRPAPYQTAGQIGALQGGFRPNGVFDRCATKLTAPVYFTGGNQLFVQSNVAYNGATGQIYIDAITIVFVDGFHYSGYPTTDSDICS